ncbi:nuclear transport factor 2 family protein [Streptomyces sp. NPDC004830]
MTIHTDESATLAVTGPHIAAAVPARATTVVPEPDGAVEGGVSALSYARVQQFYARQAVLLQESRLGEVAASFTEDGVLMCAPLVPRVRGRAAIAAALAGAYGRRSEEEPVRCRYWLDALWVEESSGGVLHACYHTLVTEVRPWHPVASVGPSAGVEDVLVVCGGRLRVRERRITLDHLSF